MRIVLKLILLFAFEIIYIYVTLGKLNTGRYFIVKVDEVLMDGAAAGSSKIGYVRVESVVAVIV